MTLGHRCGRERCDALVCLLNPQAGDGSADHQLLNLLGAFEDVVGLSWTCPLLSGGAVFVVFAGETLPGAVGW